MTDSETFEQFVRAYQSMVFTTAVRLLGSEADAADIAQEVFLKAYERFDQMRENPSAGGWLKTVATNLSLNHLSRYRARWRFFSEMFTTSSPEEWSELFPSHQPREGMDEEEFRRAHLERALQKLPPAQRVPLVLFHFEELSYEEIAARLKVSLSKVKTDIHRGRESLRRWLKPGFEQIDPSPGHPSHPRPPALERTFLNDVWLLAGT